ncbi:MAG: hypothetical protein K2J71_02755 [Oscillospiraceae bacterium]|nr:hypothetical protein [Oscillospiraceae bacterium]
MIDTNLLPEYIDWLLLISTVIFLSLISTVIFLSLEIIAIQSYKNKYAEIKKLVSRCIACQATVINPVVLTNKYTYGGLSEKSEIISDFQNFYNLPFEYVCTEVSFIVNHQKIKTMILRRATVKHPKFQDKITIYYDPCHPEQAFAKDMKGILLHQPLRNCILYGAGFIVCLLSVIVIVM